MELSREINRASAREGFPATQLRRMMKGYEKLKKLSERALKIYAERFDDRDSEIDELERLWEEAESNAG